MQTFLLKTGSGIRQDKVLLKILSQKKKTNEANTYDTSLILILGIIILDTLTHELSNSVQSITYT